jgi:aspartate/methionine/tyrosine aminotransferase
MKPQISHKAKKFKRTISPVRQIMSFADPKYIKNLGIDPDSLISFAGGWVNHNAPEELLESYSEIVTDSKNFHISGGYPPTLGDSNFKEAIIKFENTLYGTKDLETTNISVGLGSTQLAFDLFNVFLNPEDKILLLDPSYCNYPSQLVSGLDNIEILRFSVLNEETFEYEADSKISDFYNFVVEKKPKVVLLISPDNPTSQVLSDSFVKAALEACVEIGSFLVIDFAYKEIIFQKEKPEYFSWGPKENLVLLRSNSKWCRGLGRRLGWVLAPEFVIEAMESVQNSSILCPDMLHQLAMTSYIEKAISNNTLVKYVESTSKQYKLAAKETINSIKKNFDYPFLNPQGGLYTCMRVNQDGALFVDEVLKNTGVLFVPGWGFGKSLKNSVRISFGPLVNDTSKIRIGFEKVSKYLDI